METIKEIFEKEGYIYTDDNRKRSHKALQGLLNTGLITFSVCEKGKIWTNKNGFKYDVRITIKKPDGLFNHNYWKSGITNKDSYDILKIVGLTLQKESVKSFMNSYVNVDSSCPKCNGLGIIPAFHYYCNGICFDCYGLGYKKGFVPTVEVENQNMGQKELKGRKYLYQFYVSKNFDEYFPKNVRKIKETAHIGHPTAVEYFGENSNYYFIYQPICRANGWFQIPKNEIGKFRIEVKKYQNIEI